MLELLLKSPSLKALYEELKTQNSVVVEQLWDAPKALLCLLAQKATKKNILIVSGKKEDLFLENFLFLTGKEIFDFLPWEILPSQEVPPSLDITGKRLETLYKISAEKEPFLLHAPIGALMQKILPAKTLQSLCRLWKKGDEIPFDTLASFLSQLGYEKKPIASDKGQFALRGGILDLFPISSSEPYRIDFIGDEIDSIRIYDPVGQKTIRKVDEFFLCPASEWTLLQQEKKPATLLDYLGPNTLIILDDLLSIEDQYVSLKGLSGVPDKLLFGLEDFLKKLPEFSHMLWTEQKTEDLSEAVFIEKQGRDFYSGKNPFQKLSFEFFGSQFHSVKYNHPFEEVSSFFCSLENKATASLEEILKGVSRQENKHFSIDFVTYAASEEKMIRGKIAELQIETPKKTSFKAGYLASGFVLEDLQYACIPTAELTQRRKIRRQKWRNNYHSSPSEYLQLFPGDIVVHFHHGIGKFLGIEKLPNHEGRDTEFLQIEYADHGKLYVPLSQSHLVSRYIGSKEDSLTFSSLGSNKWQKTCAKTQTSIVGYAKQLLEKAAERSMVQSFVYPEDSLEVQMFEEEFPFTETEDQLSAIEDFKKDMRSSKPMDRLICGDVGYGKTEVAMRAAFKAVVDGKKQVAVLVPTTVLALQHYETFMARMSNFPIRIAALSRFCTQKESKEILKKVKEGEIDILIGTHRIISKDVHFLDLGLLIIDEEQRFGVRAKEHLKALKSGVNCITLSATPIPRTLYMSMIGIRDVSVISTPPQDRLPVRTIIAERNSETIKQALIREFSRDGQAFFIHNRVETLSKIQLEILKLLPEARIVTGHGQMDPEEIDTVFHSFKEGKADLLISTTIVENGIDISNANTILVDRADQFGMSDLYQLRGRVGRWNRPAYAYFFVNNLQTLPEIARKRLHALVEASGYGGGFKIAMRDLEIRGAGDILGEQQSGHISSVGFHLYCKLLKKAVDALKKDAPIQFIETKMEHPFDARIPETYIDDADLRMELYYRLGNASSSLDLQELEQEMLDRFGPIPREVSLLCLLARLRTLASSLGILQLKMDKFTLRIEKEQGGKTLSAHSMHPGLKDLTLFEKEVSNILRAFSSQKSR